jgi:hypothetical protein
LLRIVADEPVFASGLLLAGDVSAAEVRLQLARWVRSGRLIQLRRGLYTLSEPWRKVAPHPFLVANRLQRGSYVSLQSALAFHGVIPEHVPVVTSVGAGRPETVRGQLGTYQYQHVSARLQYGYAQVEVAVRQFAFVASPEKALLDLVHLTPGADALEYLSELRLQNPGMIRASRLAGLSERSGKPKWARAARRIDALLATQPEKPL